MTVYRKNITINVGETFSEDLTLLSSDGTGPSDLFVNVTVNAVKLPRFNVLCILQVPVNPVKSLALFV